MEKIIKPKKVRFKIKETSDIKINARNIDAWNIDARNINARNIDAWNIDARNINARNIDARNIDAWNIDARNIDAWNIDARNINARNIVQCHGNKIEVKEKIKAKVLIVYKDCKIKCKKIEARVVMIER